MPTQIFRFTERCVWIAKRVADDTDESAAPEGGGGFADYAMIPLHCLRIYLGTSYRMTIDILTEMPRITREIGLEPADLPHPSTLCLAFDRLEMRVCRVLLRYSAQLHETGEIGAIDATYFDRSRASRHYCRRTNYRVQTMKVTKLVDTDTQAILDLHCTTTWEGSDAEICEQLARKHAGELRVLTADKGYDCNWLREDLRELDIRPLIKHCVHAPYDHAHNARIDDELYGQRAMSETVFSSVKRSLGVALRARTWYREFREIALMCAVYNIKKAAKQEIPIPSCD
ncbi:IS5 family transposase [Halalkaliarchaeum sp. AArc-GB]|uniref:IS5 family transposase n=1 Tax=Halalkaliarchaeum sp. AArc-GB TaxID=3074078 RepID=UPI0028547483|nr:IS5 family transposase [Halalkaliarchaeum sp. AArc-GB]MDR5674685.1 IS5 family transposase [Halalkaliarchaeum sp. AArc-GB]